MATTSGNTQRTGSLTDNTDLSGRRGSRMQSQTSGGSTRRASSTTLSDSSISDLHDSVPSVSQGPNNSNSARPLRLGQSLASFSEWGSDSVVDASSSTLLGDSASGGGLRTASVRSIAGAAKRASSRSQAGRGRSSQDSLTLNKLKTANLGLVGRDKEKALLRDAYARVVAGLGTDEQLGRSSQGGGSPKSLLGGEDIDSVTDSTCVSLSSSSFSAGTSSAKTRDSLSEHVEGRRAQEAQAQAGPSGAAAGGNKGQGEDGGVPTTSDNGLELVLVAGHS